MIVHVDRNRRTTRLKKPRYSSNIITPILFVVGVTCLALSIQWFQVPGIMEMGFPAATEGIRNYNYGDADEDEDEDEDGAMKPLFRPSKPQKQHEREQERSETDPAIQPAKKPQQQEETPARTRTRQPSQPSRSKKLFFAVHIGPSKPGTSAIQKSLATLPFETDTMDGDRDNVLYVGKRTLAKWKDPNLHEPIRTVGGVSFTPADETRAYQRHARKCMLGILNEYYETHADDGTGVLEDRLEHDEATRESLKKRFTDECWMIEMKLSNSRRSANKTRTTATTQTHDFRYMLGWSIVDSNESHSYVNQNWVEKGRIFRVFDILGYETLRLVAAYRRYAEWTVSCHTQKVKTVCLRDVDDAGLLRGVPCERFDEYIGRDLRRSGNGGGRFNSRMYTNIDRTLPRIAAAGPSKLKVKIMNFFQQQNESSPSPSSTSYDSITTELYCDALGTELTPHACNHSREIWKKSKLDEDNTTTTITNSTSTNNTAAAAAEALVVNKGSTSDGIYHSIIAAGYRLGYLLPSDEDVRRTAERKKRCGAAASSSKKKKRRGSSSKGGAEPNLGWCEAVGACLDLSGGGAAACDRERDQRVAEREDATARGAVTIAGVRDHPVSSYRELSRYHTGVHRASWTETLPVRCPPERTLGALLARSLELEETVLPGFAATPSGRREHERLFRDVWVREKRLFCRVDTDRLFANATSWDEILDDRMVRRDHWEVSYDDGDGDGDGMRRNRIASTTELPWVDV